MKIRAEIELPMSVEHAYDKFIANVKNGQPFPGIKAFIETEVGNLGPGTVIKVEMQRPTKINYKATITENNRPDRFTMVTDVGYSKTFSETKFQPLDSGCLVILEDNFELNWNWQGIVVSLFPQTTIKFRRNTWEHIWLQFKPEGKLFRKFSARHWGLPSALIGVFAWIILVVFSTFFFQIMEHGK